MNAEIPIISAQAFTKLGRFCMICNTRQFGRFNLKIGAIKLSHSLHDSSFNKQSDFQPLLISLRDQNSNFSDPKWLTAMAMSVIALIFAVLALMIHLVLICCCRGREDKPWGTVAVEVLCYLIAGGSSSLCIPFFLVS